MVLQSCFILIAKKNETQFKGKASHLKHPLINRPLFVPIPCNLLPGGALGAHTQSFSTKSPEEIMIDEKQFFFLRLLVTAHLFKMYIIVTKNFLPPYFCPFPS